MEKYTMTFTTASTKVKVLVPNWMWQSSKLGAPSDILRSLKVFYFKQSKTMEWQGFTSEYPPRCTRGLLQGCPCSCPLLAGLMTVWLKAVKQVAPAAEFSIFVDDRTLWTSDPLKLTLALERSQRLIEPWVFFEYL